MLNDSLSCLPGYRVEYTHVNLARKLGGICDIDQIYILNSVDGPTTGQCGPLSGYASKSFSL